MNVRRSRWRERYQSPQLTASMSTRSGRKLRLPLGLILTLIALGGVLWGVLGSGYFLVREISISGTLNETVAVELEALRGRNILLLRTAVIEAELPNHQSSLKSLHIIKGFPATLKIAVVVREPALRWQSRDQQLYIDRDGFAFTIEGGATDQWNTLPQVVDEQAQSVRAGDRIVSRRFVSFVRDLSDTFSQRVGRSIQSLSIGETTRHIAVRTDTGLIVLFDITRSIDTQTTSLARVLDQYRDAIHEYVDLRVEGKVFFK